MEIIFQIVEMIPLFFVMGSVFMATRAKENIEEIKHLVWAILWVVVAIANTVL